MTVLGISVAVSYCDNNNLIYPHLSLSHAGSPISQEKKIQTID